MNSMETALNEGWDAEADSDEYAYGLLRRWEAIGEKIAAYWPQPGDTFYMQFCSYCDACLYSRVEGGYVEEHKEGCPIREIGELLAEREGEEEE